LGTIAVLRWVIDDPSEVERGLIRISLSEDWDFGWFSKRTIKS